MNFWRKKPNGGVGGGHIRSKTFYCNLFCFRNGNFGHEFPEKPLKNVHCKNGAGATGLQKNCNILFRKRGGGGRFFLPSPKLRCHFLPLTFWARQKSIGAHRQFRWAHFDPFSAPPQKGNAIFGKLWASFWLVKSVFVGTDIVSMS